MIVCAVVALLFAHVALCRHATASAAPAPAGVSGTTEHGDEARGWRGRSGSDDSAGATARLTATNWDEARRRLWAAVLTAFASLDVSQRAVRQRAEPDDGNRRRGLAPRTESLCLAARPKVAVAGNGLYEGPGSLGPVIVCAVVALLFAHVALCRHATASAAPAPAGVSGTAEHGDDGRGWRGRSGSDARHADHVGFDHRRLQ